MPATAAQAQPGILDALAPLGRSLAFRLNDHNIAHNLQAALTRLREVFAADWGVVGLGMPLVDALDQHVAGLRPFPALEGHGCAAPSTQQAMWILLRGSERSSLFERTAQLVELLGDALVLEDALDTFRYRDNRDLTGYEDGTENPKDAAAIAAALVAEGAGRQGSSFVAVQRWIHDLTRFRGFPAAQRDASIGRQISDNEEIEDAPESAHAKRTAQESFTPEAYMVRHSMPWDTGLQQGTEFIAYGESSDRFENVLRRMLGHEDNIVDALFSFSRPVTGGYYWCPPLRDGRLDLSSIGI
ncbi:putative iron-dependent peroxidase [Collimonas sp. OK307]|uniref:Dyp-type peroxidase n=1 Tax=Collimonas sp. OK307 TaxID=1801620 RepID=UPI0008F340F0|nr:Dyp-type peroxidase [Collimonas sp. OK307]SFI10040.1 putative iron-dependent peroxidase [Collimonas sp. OK307]